MEQGVKSLLRLVKACAHSAHGLLPGSAPQARHARLMHQRHLLRQGARQARRRARLPGGTAWPRAGITGICLISCLGKEHTLLEHACWVQRKLSLVPGRDCVWTSSSILTCCATCACNHRQLVLCALSSGSSDDALPAPACPSPFAGVYQLIPRLPFLPCRLAPLPSPVADSLLASPTPLMLLAGG